MFLTGRCERIVFRTKCYLTWTTFTKVLQHSNSAFEPHGCMNRAAVVQAASCLGSSGFQGRKPITNRAVSNEGTRTGAIWDAASLDSIPKVTTGCTCCRLSPAASFRLMASQSPRYASNQLGMKNLGLFYLRLPICVFVEIKPRLSPSPSFGNMILVDTHVFAGLQYHPKQIEIMLTSLLDFL